MQVHLVGPDYDQVGTPQVGFPVAVVGFNRHTGWGRTVNTIDTVDFYRLTVKNDQYVFDGALRPFERETRTLKVKQPDGSFREERLDIRRSVHGPVVFDENGVTVAMRVAGLDRPKMLEQWFRMGEARSLQEFQSALRMMSVPMWHANYADDRGTSCSCSTGWCRDAGRTTTNTGRASCLATRPRHFWTDYLSFDELPKSIDPPSGWHQNANEPPWLMTLPRLDRSKFPAYVAPTGEALPQMRTPPFAAHDYRGSEDQLRTAPREEAFDADGAGRQNSPGPSQRRGGHRCRASAREMGPPHRRRQPRRRAVSVVRRPILLCGQRRDGTASFASNTTPNGRSTPLRASPIPASAAAALVGGRRGMPEAVRRARREMGRRLSVCEREGRSSRAMAVPAAPGCSARSRFRGARENKFYAASGETIVCAIEFARTQRAQCLLGYGNATQPGSPHLEDQLPLMVQKKLLPVHA